MKTNTLRLKKTLSKIETFGSIIENLEKLYPTGISGELIISKMIESNVFTKMQARDYFERIHKSGFIYESKSGYFNTVC